VLSSYEDRELLRTTQFRTPYHTVPRISTSGLPAHLRTRLNEAPSSFGVTRDVMLSASHVAATALLQKWPTSCHVFVKWPIGQKYWTTLIELNSKHLWPNAPSSDTHRSDKPRMQKLKASLTSLHVVSLCCSVLCFSIHFSFCRENHLGLNLPGALPAFHSRKC